MIYFKHMVFDIHCDQYTSNVIAMFVRSVLVCLGGSLKNLKYYHDIYIFIAYLIISLVYRQFRVGLYNIQGKLQPLGKLATIMFFMIFKFISGIFLTLWSFPARLLSCIS